MGPTWALGPNPRRDQTSRISHFVVEALTTDSEQVGALLAATVGALQGGVNMLFLGLLDQLFDGLGQWRGEIDGGHGNEVGGITGRSAVMAALFSATFIVPALAWDRDMRQFVTKKLNLRRKTN